MNMQSQKRLTGMVGFTIVWAGQLISVLASSMTQFALTIWAYQETGSATALGIIGTAFIVPFLLFSPIAGVMVDRHNRKLMMMVSDFAAVLSTVGILVLQAFGALEIWHLYIASIINGLGNTFQWPAYSAAISTMVPKENYSHANGMMSLVESGPAVLAPIFAGVLLPIIQLTGILVVDVVTFFFAILALVIVHVPQPEKTVEGQAGGGSIFQEALYGFKYIFARRGLLGLLLFFIVLNFVIGLSISLFSPFILERTNQSSEILGVVTSANGIVQGEARLHIHPEYRSPQLQDEMLAQAETALFTTEDGTPFVYLPVDSDDSLLHETLINRGYEKNPGRSNKWRRDLDAPIPEVKTPADYKIRSMGGEEEHPARSWASWRSFHSEEPNENYDGDYSWIRNMQSAPLYRRDLDIVATALNGEIASFCTIYYDDYTRSAVCVLVGTAAEHWQRGLGKAVIYEGMRRLQRLGCTRIFATAFDPPANALYGSVMNEKQVAETWLKVIK